MVKSPTVPRLYPLWPCHLVYNNVGANLKWMVLKYKSCRKIHHFYLSTPRPNRASARRWSPMPDRGWRRLPSAKRSSQPARHYIYIYLFILLIYLCIYHIMYIYIYIMLYIYYVIYILCYIYNTYYHR